MYLLLKPIWSEISDGTYGVYYTCHLMSVSCTLKFGSGAILAPTDINIISCVNAVTFARGYFYVVTIYMDSCKRYCIWHIASNGYERTRSIDIWKFYITITNLSCSIVGYHNFLSPVVPVSSSLVVIWVHVSSISCKQITFSHHHLPCGVKCASS